MLLGAALLEYRDLLRCEGGEDRDECGGDCWECTCRGRWGCVGCGGRVEPWKGVRSFHLKLMESVALPVYQTLPEAVVLRVEEVKEVVKSESGKKEKVGKKGRIHEVRYLDGNARKVFDEMLKRDVISWSSTISGYVKSGELERGLECFKDMRDNGVRLNEATLVSVLSASAQMGLLEHGRLVHEIAESFSFPMIASLGTALIDMYAKCGCIQKSKLLFENMPMRDIWTWNVMICGLASHGLGREALDLFARLIHDGFCLVNVTFVGVLGACSRACLVSEGRHHFKLMTEKYGIRPEMEHYGCMVDLLGRAGFVDEAVEMVEKMTVPPDPVLWATLLGACKMQGSIELGEKIGNKLIKIDPTHDGHYVQLANIYAKENKWEDVIRVRRMMVEQNTNKAAGWSLIEAQGKVHKFVAGDREHEHSLDIYRMLDTIVTRIVEAGYSMNVSSVLHDIGEEEKENAIKEHSERLANCEEFKIWKED